jgi:hypothetical protein
MQFSIYQKFRNVADILECSDCSDFVAVKAQALYWDQQGEGKVSINSHAKALRTFKFQEALIYHLTWFGTRGFGG